MEELLKNKISDINEQYFGLDELPAIVWSRGRIKRRYRRLTLGSYHYHKNEIRIHPLFREREIPDYVLEYVIFHELLHFEDRNELKRRRRGDRIHSAEFHSREREYPRKKEASRYVKNIMLNGLP
ncbi:MAG: M48 family metallopeptidase [Brevinematales bacterium]|nr:M48 family metallopeptidase [Brevinematales bacterium]